MLQPDYLEARRHPDTLCVLASRLVTRHLLLIERRSKGRQADDDAELPVGASTAPSSACGDAGGGGPLMPPASGGGCQAYDSAAPPMVDSTGPSSACGGHHPQEGADRLMILRRYLLWPPTLAD